MIEVSWPGQPFLDRTIHKGDVLLVTGTVRFFHGRQLQPREFVNLGDERRRDATRDACSRCIPRRRGCRSRSFARSSTRISTRCSRSSTEYLPPRRAVARRRCPRSRDALRMVHRPTSLAEAMRRTRAARVRGAVLRAAAAPARQGARARASRRGIRFENKRELTSRLREALPFELTGAQVARAARDRRRHVRASAACTACCRATSAAARRSSRSSPRCSRWRTAIRRRSWRRPSCSPSSTRAR